MLDLFITDDQEVIIKIAIAKNKKKETIVDESKEEMLKAYKGEIDEETIEEHEIAFKHPSFGDSVSIGGNITTKDGVNVDFNPFRIRYETMSNLLKSWTFKDSNGDAVPATSDSLKKLSPKIANFIGLLLDEKIGSF